MRVTINQPAYLPWGGWVDRIAAADLFISLDHVQFEKNSMVNRNRIRCPQGQMWLTIPVASKGRFGDLAIDGLTTTDRRWCEKHARSIAMNYSKCAHWQPWGNQLLATFAEHDSDVLLPLIKRQNTLLLSALGITTRQLSSREMAPQASKSELVLELCRAVGATTYISGPFGRGYLDRAAFASAGIQVLFHSFHPPVYAHRHPIAPDPVWAWDTVFHLGSLASAALASGRELSASWDVAEVSA